MLLMEQRGEELENNILRNISDRLPSNGNVERLSSKTLMCSQVNHDDLGECLPLPGK